VWRIIAREYDWGVIPLARSTDSERGSCFFKDKPSGCSVCRRVKRTRNPQSPFALGDYAPREAESSLRGRVPLMLSETMQAVER
jgi:hypothetical protein